MYGVPTYRVALPRIGLMHHSKMQDVPRIIPSKWAITGQARTRNVPWELPTGRVRYQWIIDGINPVPDLQARLRKVGIYEDQPSQCGVCGLECKVQAIGVLNALCSVPQIHGQGYQHKLLASNADKARVLHSSLVLA